jgi:exodeoxyribonuclease V beta subunit
VSFVHPKPPILDEVAATRHAVLEASAGTGKTYALEHLVIDVLLESNATLEEILVVTFTEKAAAELRHRLRKKIAEIHDTKITEVEGSRWVIDRAAERKLARALMSFDAASISTIHAFCQRVLVENAFANLRLFEQRLIDGRAAFSRAFLDVLREHLAREAEPRSYLAGWLEEHDLDDLESILHTVHGRRGELRPSFSHAELMKAARYLASIDLRPHALKPALSRARLPSAVVDALLTRIGLLRRHLTVLDQTEDLPEFLAALDREERMHAPFTSYIVDELKRAVTHQGALQRVLEGVEALVAAAPTFESAIVQVFLPRVEAYLSHGKKRSGQLDFDDMLAMVKDSLEGPEGETLAGALRSRFRWAMIDEFQDTDEVQWAIFSKIFLEGDSTRLYVIGDPKQAIYAFRGADVHTYLSAKERIKELGGRTVHLVENHRSARPMLEALNVLLDQRAADPFFTGEIRYDHPVTCGRPSFEGLAKDGELLSPIHLLRVVPAEEKLTPSSARNTLARRIAVEIRSLLDDRVVVREDGRDQPLKANEIFVLTRSGREGLEVARQLRRAKVPYSFYKQDGLFQTAEAREVRSLLHAIADPHRRDRRFRAWQTPFFSVPLESLLDCRDLPGTHPLVETLFVWKALADAKQYNRLFTSIIDGSGIVERELFSKAGERELTNYLHIFEVLLEEADRTRATLPELIAALTSFIEARRSPAGEEGNVQRIESERDAVQIMTMHKAKGLEASVVFLYGGLDEVPEDAHLYHEGHKRCLYLGRNPPAAARIESREENQRLLYVSMTRAKARLYLPYFGFTAGVESAEPERVLRKLDGAYAELNRVLDRIEPNLRDLEPLFTIETIEEAPRRDPIDPPEDLERIGTWNPPAELLVAPEPRTDLLRVRERARGFVVTSYSKIKASRGGYHGFDAAFEPETIVQIAEDVDAVTIDPTGMEMPPGAETGRFIHELLEEVPLEAVKRGALLEDHDVRALFERTLRRYGFDPQILPHAVDLVHTSYAGPLLLGGDLLPGVVHADRTVREMEFMYPIPGAPSRGFIKGFIDLVFEWRGKIYVADWKSDLLPGYSPAELTPHVDENYRVQAELYTLAMVKLFGLSTRASFDERFGGTVYCFVRGMEKQGSGERGVFFIRPDYDAVLATERGLAEEVFGG